MDTESITLKTFCICFTVIILSEIFGPGLLVGQWDIPYLSVGILRVWEILTMLFLIRFFQGNLRCIGLGKEMLAPGVQKGLIWSAAFGGLVSAAFLILHLSGTNPLKLFSMRLPRDINALIVLFTVAAILGPLAEEIIFRGILYGFFRRWGIIPAFLLSCSLFVLLHSGFGIVQIIGGILFTLAYEKEKKLMTPVCIHVLGNAALFFLPLL